MNRDEIAQMMQDAAGANWGTEAHFQRFAALVAAHEREACALVCESTITPNIDWWNDACQSCADDIRARGEA